MHGRSKCLRTMIPLTPTAQQEHVLYTVHFRALTEEYALAGEDIPDAIWRCKPPAVNVGMPLLRLIHGLPGSGKSELMKWLKQYFENVWLWKKNKQFALIAPMNMMVGNIGGTTIHSVGRIPFKGKRGNVVQSGKGAEPGGSIFTDEEYHELRFVLMDEVEAAGVSLFGRLEDSLRLNVPRTSTLQAIQGKQHCDRRRQIAFAGVNVLCFGGFWQLDPTGIQPSCQIRRNTLATRAPT